MSYIYIYSFSKCFWPHWFTKWGKTRKNISNIPYCSNTKYHVDDSTTANVLVMGLFTHSYILFWYLKSFSSFFSFFLQEFKIPHDIVVTADGSVFVGDAASDSVMKFVQSASKFVMYKYTNMWTYQNKISNKNMNIRNVYTIFLQRTMSYFAHTLLFLFWQASCDW